MSKHKRNAINISEKRLSKKQQKKKNKEEAKLRRKNN